MIIKITNGEVHIKDIYPRKLKKQINTALYENIDMKTNNDGATEFGGFKLKDMDNANDISLLGMVEKLVINGEEKDINIDTFDNMDSNDVDKIIEAINKITSKQIPNG